MHPWHLSWLSFWAVYQVSVHLDLSFLLVHVAWIQRKCIIEELFVRLAQIGNFLFPQHLVDATTKVRLCLQMPWLLFVETDFMLNIRKLAML